MKCSHFRFHRSKHILGNLHKAIRTKSANFLKCNSSLVPLSRKPRSAFTIVELLVVVTIITVLITLILPAIQGAREVAQSTVCAGNMRQISIAISTYATDNGTKYPYGTLRPGVGPFTSTNPTTTYDILIDPYLGGKGFDPTDPTTYQNMNPNKLPVLICPKDPFRGTTSLAPRSYGMTAAISGGDSFTAGVYPASVILEAVVDPAGTFVLVETPNGTGTGRGRQGGGGWSLPCNQSGPLMALTNPSYVVFGNPPYTVYTAHPYGTASHPNDTFNYMFADGHAKAFYPLDTDTRAAIGGAPRAGMRGFGSGPGGYYWYNSGSATGGWSLAPND